MSRADVSLQQFLKDRMSECRVSQEDVVRALRKNGLNVGRASVSRWLNGHSHPPRKVFGPLLDVIACYGNERTRACRLYSGVSLDS